MAKYVLFVFLCLIFMDTSAEALSLRPEKKHSEVQVKRVIDGDTLELSDGRLIRLIGVDCPEFNENSANSENASRRKIPYPHFVTFATEAKQFLEKRIGEQPVQIETDPNFKFFKHSDLSDRLWVYLSKNKILINEELIGNGYCFVHDKYQFRYRKEFLEKEKEAKEKRIGIWSQNE
jgi:micrococcal nuclease